MAAVWTFLDISMPEDQDSVTGSDGSVTQRHVSEERNSQRLWALKYIIYKNSRLERKKWKKEGLNLRGKWVGTEDNAWWEIW